MKHYVIGVDYGSDSARAVVIDTRTGEEIAQAVAGYPRWLAGKYQDAGRRMYRQHPLDYIEALTATVRSVAEQVGEEVRKKYCRAVHRRHRLNSLPRECGWHAPGPSAGICGKSRRHVPPLEGSYRHQGIG